MHATCTYVDLLEHSDGCHGLHVDAARLVPVGQRVPGERQRCLVCGSDAAENEHVVQQLVYDCTASINSVVNFALPV